LYAVIQGKFTPSLQYLNKKISMFAEVVCMKYRDDWHLIEKELKLIKKLEEELLGSKTLWSIYQQIKHLN